MKLKERAVAREIFNTLDDFGHVLRGKLFEAVNLVGVFHQNPNGFIAHPVTQHPLGKFEFRVKRCSGRGTIAMRTNIFPALFQITNVISNSVIRGVFGLRAGNELAMLFGVEQVHNASAQTISGRGLFNTLANAHARPWKNIALVVEHGSCVIGHINQKPPGNGKLGT